MRTVLISLVQSINGSYAEDEWSTGISTPQDFAYFMGMRRRAGAIIIDRRTALNPKLPVVNAPGKRLEHTPVHVLTTSSATDLAAELGRRGLNYQAHHFTPATIAEVIAGLDANSESLLCEAGPHLSFRLLDLYPETELHMSISPLYVRSAGTHLSTLEARVPLRLVGVDTKDDQVFLRYRRGE